MAAPHPALIDVAAGRPAGAIDNPGTLIRSAVEHRMHGLLLTEIEQGRLEVPHEIQVKLATLCLRTRAHHQRLWAALDDVATTLDQQGVAVASAKGVTSELRWFDRMGERPSLDLDLFLDPAQNSRAGEIVATLQPSHPLAADVRELAVSGALQSVDIAFSGVPIDLHFDIFKLGVPLLHNEAIWQRRVAMRSPGGATLSALDPETSLALSLLHLLKDRFALLSGFVDVARIMSRESLDWSYLRTFLHSEGLEAPAFHALDVVCETLRLANPIANTSAGWRRVATRVLWPRSIRMQGREGRVRHHRRQFFLPFLMPGRRAAATCSLVRLVVPPHSLIDFYYPETSGPVVWRLAAGRVHRALERRDMLRHLKAPPPPAASRLQATSADRPREATSYKQIPPRSGYILTPAGSRDAARAAIAMYSASRRGARAAQRVAMNAVTLAGSAVLPGRPQPWRPPDHWDSVEPEIIAAFGPVDETVIYRRPQPEREGFALLTLRGGTPSAFVKLQPAHDSRLGREEAALRAMRRAAPRSFSVPDVLASGTVAAWCYLALEPFPVAIHRPAHDPPLEEMVEEIAAGLANLPRPVETPHHWIPMHGDLTPWNLRQFPDGRLILLDWEHAGWGPPGADLVLYTAAAAALGLRTAAVAQSRETAEFWQNRFATGALTRRDLKLRKAVMQSLVRREEPG